MEPTSTTSIRKITLFLALVTVIALEFLFALSLGYAVLHYLNAVMELAQLPDVNPGL